MEPRKPANHCDKNYYEWHEIYVLSSEILGLYPGEKCNENAKHNKLYRFNFYKTIKIVVVIVISRVCM